MMQKWVIVEKTLIGNCGGGNTLGITCTVIKFHSKGTEDLFKKQYTGSFCSFDMPYCITLLLFK